MKLEDKKKKSTTLFVSKASEVDCPLLTNSAWTLAQWYHKPAHFVETKEYPRWRNFLTHIIPQHFTGEPVAYYNAQWQTATVKHSEVCGLLDIGQSVALGEFLPGENGKVRRRANLQVYAPGITLDVDEGIPADIQTCQDLVIAVPILQYATGVRESISSRSPRKIGHSQFRAYFGFEKPIKTDSEKDEVAVRTRELLGEWLAKQVVYAPESIAKNAVCVAYGNAGTQSKIDTEYLISADLIDHFTEKARQHVEAERKQEQAKQIKEKARAETRQNTPVQIEGESRPPLQVFQEDVDPILYMTQAGWITHLRGDDYNWTGSHAGRSCVIKDDVIRPFSDTMVSETPDGKPKPVNAHRFIIYKLTGGDIKKESDRQHINTRLAELGYGMSPEDFRKQLAKQSTSTPFPPLAEVLKAQAESIDRAIENAPTPEPRYTRKPKLTRQKQGGEIETETLDENEASREHSTIESINTPLGKTHRTHITIVKDVTGSGKSYTTLAKAKSEGKRPISVHQYKEHAAQAVEMAWDIGFRTPFQFKGRGQNWNESEIAEIPVEDRTPELFDKNLCIMYDEVEKHTAKRLSAGEYCFTKCPFIEDCPYWGQYTQVEMADALTLTTPNLLFDPGLHGYLKRIIRDEDGETLFDMAAVDDYTVASLYNEQSVGIGELKLLKANWKGHAVSDFADNLLDVFKLSESSEIYDHISEVLKGMDTETKKQVRKQLTQHPRKGVVEQSAVAISDKETRQLLSEWEITFTDGGKVKVAVDEIAFETLVDRGIPTVRIDRSWQVGSEVVVPYAPFRALAAGVKLQDLAPVWQKKWTLLHQLQALVKHVGNPNNAPVSISEDTILCFSTPPKANKLIPKIFMLSATAEPSEVKNAFKNQNSIKWTEVVGKPLEWASGVNVFQFEDGRNTSASVFEYAVDDEGKRQLQTKPTGLTPTASHRITKLNEWAKQVDGFTAFISYKEFTESFQSHLDGFDITTHFDRVAGLNFDGLKYLILFGYPKVSHSVVMEHARMQYTADSEPLPTGDYEHLTETAEYQQDGITVTETRYKDLRLEKIRHQLSTDKLIQAIGRIRLPRWEDTNTVVFTSTPVPSITERATLFGTAAFNLATSPDDLPAAQERITTAEQNGDVKAVAETQGVSQRTAERRTQSARVYKKAERDTRILELHSEGKSTREIESIMETNKNKVSRATINRVIKVSQKRQVQLRTLIGDVANETPLEKRGYDCVSVDSDTETDTKAKLDSPSSASADDWRTDPYYNADAIRERLKDAKSMSAYKEQP